MGELDIESRRTGKGKRKIEIKSIEKKEARQVCFSKRRHGLFKKANDLSILTGGQVGAIVFSTAGKPFSFGSPSLDAVIDRFLHANGGNDSSAGSDGLSDAQQRLSQQHTELYSLIETEKRGLNEVTNKLLFLLEKKMNLEEMTTDQLLEFEREILDCKKVGEQPLMERNQSEGFEIPIIG